MGSTPSSMTLPIFDDAVVAALSAPERPDGLRHFFRSARHLLCAKNVNLVIFRGSDRCTAFGIHEIDTIDLVPEMGRFADHRVWCGMKTH